MMDELLRYFPDLSPTQRERFAAMGSLYAQWNALINVISRQDTEHFYLHHVLHSLAIARVVDFAPGARILDAGTGGGFPGIPLAVLFPQVHFTLVDSIGKKTKVAADIAGQLSLENVSVVNARIESLPVRLRRFARRRPHGEDRRLDPGKDPAGKSVEPSQRHPLSEGRRPGRRTRSVSPGEDLRHIGLFL